MNNKGKIYTFIELRSGIPIPLDFEILGEAARLASPSNMKVCAVLLEESINIETLFYHGADEVHILVSSEKVDYTEDIAIRLIGRFIIEQHVDIFMIGGTVFGKSIAAGLAGLLQTGLTADCTGLQIKDGLLWQSRPAFEGNTYATIICENRRPQMATIRSGVMKPLESDLTRTGRVYRYKSGIDVAGAYEIIDRNSEKQNTCPLEKAKVVVGIGMGIAIKKNIEELCKLADHIGAMTGATRAVVDSGLMSAQQQIGLTGNSIQPELYIACGISGSSQHMSGVSARMIVAVNTDRSSPIFQYAQYGIVGDAMDVVPELLEKIALQNSV